MAEKWLKIEVDKTITIDVFVRTSDEQIEALARQDIASSIDALQRAVADPETTEHDRKHYQESLARHEAAAPDLTRVPRAMVRRIEQDLEDDYDAFDHGSEMIDVFRNLEEVPADEARQFSFLDLLEEGGSPS